MKSLQDMLGHTTAAMTLDVYAHPSDKRQREVVGGIQERFRGLAKGEENRVSNHVCGQNHGQIPILTQKKTL